MFVSHFRFLPLQTLFLSLCCCGTTLLSAQQTCTPPDGRDTTINDLYLWNADYWQDPVHNSHNLSEMGVDLQMRLDGICPWKIRSVKYILRLDLDRDGATETVVHNGQTQQPGMIWVGNAQNPDFSGGTLRRFDTRQVTDTLLDCYKFALQITQGGDSAVVALRFTTARFPGFFTLPRIPHGKHRMEWTVLDGCGKTHTCKYDFEVKDAKKPVIHCKPALTINFTSPYIYLYASDFLEYATDNATPPEQLELAAALDQKEPLVFPFDSVIKQPQASIPISCSNLQFNNILRTWVRDKAGNTGFCITQLTLMDPNWNCIDPVIVTGSVQTTQKQPMSGVKITTTTIDTIMPARMVETISLQGNYRYFGNFPLNSICRTCLSFNQDPLNGVTTLDLIRITKHILGVDPLETPYKMIAADANNSGTITTQDVVELRKLILGIYDSLPESNSWRFVPNSYVFPIPFDGKAPECLEFVFNNLNDALRFTGIKIGDVNDSAIPAFSGSSIDNRSENGLAILLKDRLLTPGEVFDLHFPETAPLLAQQFTLYFPHLEWLGLVPETGNVDLAHFASFPEAHRLTHAWSAGSNQAEPVAFTLRFRARTHGRLRDLLQIVDTPTPALAYDAAEAPARVQLSYMDLETPSTAIRMVQNRPNPFVQNTTIGFYLEEAGPYRLTVLDQNGRLVFEQKNQGEKGYNNLIVNFKNPLPSGVYVGKIESNHANAVLKMIKQ